MTRPPAHITATRRAELERLAQEIARQSAWCMALEDQPIPDSVVAELASETFVRLLESERLSVLSRATKPRAQP